MESNNTKNSNFSRFAPRKYRPKQSSNPAIKKPEKYTPKDLADFIDIIKRSPENVLSKNDKNRIAAVMSFESHIVSDLMVAKKDMVFVNEKDLLGEPEVGRRFRGNIWLQGEIRV